MKFRSGRTSRPVTQERDYEIHESQRWKSQWRFGLRFVTFLLCSAQAAFRFEGTHLPSCNAPSEGCLFSAVVVAGEAGDTPTTDRNVFTLLSRPSESLQESCRFLGRGSGQPLPFHPFPSRVPRHGVRHHGFRAVESRWDEKFH